MTYQTDPNTFSFSSPCNATYTSSCLKFPQMNVSFHKFSYIPQHKAHFSCYSLFNARNLLFFTIYINFRPRKEIVSSFRHHLILLLFFIETRFHPTFSMGIRVMEATAFFFLFVYVISGEFALSLALNYVFIFSFYRCFLDKYNTFGR